MESGAIELHHAEDGARPSLQGGPVDREGHFFPNRRDRFTLEGNPQSQPVAPAKRGLKEECAVYIRACRQRLSEARQEFLGRRFKRETEGDFLFGDLLDGGVFLILTQTWSHAAGQSSDLASGHEQAVWSLGVDENEGRVDLGRRKKDALPAHHSERGRLCPESRSTDRFPMCKHLQDP